RAGQLDFMDLLLEARNLLRHEAARAGLQVLYDRIFVDEFQDTDPLQAEILLLLAASDPAERDWRKAAPAPGKLFVVGDPKQSIYRFRRADARLFRRVCSDLKDAGASGRELTSSRRSTTTIQSFVNAAFEKWIPVQPEHVCILFRRFTNFGVDLTQEYVRALEARGIAHLLVGSKSFHRREEIGTLRAALRAIEWPDDELSVFAVLRGSLCAIL